MPRLSEFLGELSFGGYREVGYDKVLLVEGVNEVKTVQQWLRLLHKDHTIVVLQLGGSNLINGERRAELAEITRISPHVAAIIDSERTAPGPISRARQEFQAACDELGIACSVLQRRATENYFPQAALQRAFGRPIESLDPFEALGGRWAKSDNWRVAREMTIEEVDATDDLVRVLRAL